MRKGTKMTEESKRKISKTQKEMFAKGLIIPVWLGKKHTEQYKKQMSISLRNSDKWKEKHYRLLPQMGLYEKEILDYLEKNLGHNIIRSYPIKDYWLDGYCKELNLAFEVDDSDHYNKLGNLKMKDVVRQDNIRKILKCGFIRIKVRDYLDSLK